MPDHFFKTYVTPAYDSWQSNPQDIRLAKTLALELNNIAERYWKLKCTASFKNLGLYRDNLTRILPEFALIRDVAECHKHLELGRPSAQVKSDNDVTVEHIGYGQGYGVRYGGGDVVILKMENGNIECFDSIAETVYQYWKSLLT